MRKKTESLTFPKDPLAAMRELQDLNLTSPSDIPTSVRTEPAPEDTRRRDDATPPSSAEHPLQDAILQLLAAPYPPTLARGPFTVTSVKIHTEIWNRVGLAATLTGRPKQEILADALRAYLETLCAPSPNAGDTVGESEARPRPLR